MEEEKRNWDLIFLRLETIVENQESFSDRLGNIEKQLNVIGNHEYEIKALKDWRLTMETIAYPSNIKDLLEWKHKLDEIVSSTQLKEKLTDIESLKTFKTQALMIWIVIQTLMAIALFAQKLL